MRKPIVAGQFYPANKEQLTKFVKKFLAKEKKNVHAVISPHAGYMFSGKLAGKTLGMINEKKDFIMLGVNHSGQGSKVSFSLEDWETPLGIVKNNKALAEKIIHALKKEKIDCEIDEQAHLQEHSLEVQLPFLQVSQKKFEIIPILLSRLSYDECKKVAKIISSFINEKEALIVSSDFTHYGASYGFIPFTDDVKENLFELDEKMILEISRNNSKAFFSLAEKSTVCGMLGITILCEIAKAKDWQAKLVEYYTSGEISGDWSTVVGYAGIVFE